MKTLRFLLGDHLTREISSLADATADEVVFMAEVAEETTYVRHHKQKIALVLSAMRHFADELREEGLAVDYVRLDDPENCGNFVDELKRAIKRHQATRVVVAEPGEWRVLEALRGADLGPRLEICNDDRFFVSPLAFARWARGRSNLRMEHFYREIRRAHAILMDGDTPVGGRWNFDAENRKPPPGIFIRKRRRASRRTRRRAKCSIWWRGGLPVISAISSRSAGRRRAARRSRRCAASSAIICRHSAITRTRWPRANPSCTTRPYRRI